MLNSDGGAVKVSIIIPTLAKGEGHMAGELARMTAGLLCNVIVSHDSAGEGFTRTVNRGLRKALASGATHICLLNDDVRVEQEGWLRRLIEASEEDPRYGVAAPGGNCRTKPQMNSKPGLPAGIVEVKQLAFFCAVIKRELFDAIGLLDEDFIHYGSDSDFCMRTIEAGWKCVWVRDVYVEHAMGAYVEEWRRHDRELFRRRWNF